MRYEPTFSDGRTSLCRTRERLSTLIWYIEPFLATGRTRVCSSFFEYNFLRDFERALELWPNFSLRVYVLKFESEIWMLNIPLFSFAWSDLKLAEFFSEWNIGFGNCVSMIRFLSNTFLKFSPRVWNVCDDYFDKLWMFNNSRLLTVASCTGHSRRAEAQTYYLLGPDFRFISR